MYPTFLLKNNFSFILCWKRQKTVWLASITYDCMHSCKCFVWTVMKSMIFFICISVQGKNNIPLSYKSCNFEILKIILFNQWNCLTWTWNKITKTWWYFIGWVHFWRKFLQGMWHFCLSIISKYSDLHF